MLDIQSGVFARLNGDVSLANMLASWKGRPAIVGEPIPPDFEVAAEEPSIIVSTPTSQEHEADSTSRYRRVEMRVRAYHKPDGSTLKLDQVAERIVEVMRTWDGAITGGIVRNGAVSGPAPAPAEDPALEGRVVIVRLFIEEA